MCKNKFVKGDRFDERDEPVDFVYQNTYSFAILEKYIKSLGNYSVELIDDTVNLKVLDSEMGTIGKRPGGTKTAGNLQISGNMVYNWKWLKITGKSATKMNTNIWH